MSVHFGPVKEQTAPVNMSVVGSSPKSSRNTYALDYVMPFSFSTGKTILPLFLLLSFFLSVLVWYHQVGEGKGEKKVIHSNLKEGGYQEGPGRV